MKGFCHLVFLGLLGLSLGQDIDYLLTEEEVVWTEGLNVDDMGSTPFDVMSSSGGSGHDSYVSHTPKPVVGAGGALAADAVHEADAAGGESVQMVFVGYPLKLTCNFTNEEGTAVTLDWYKGEDEIKENDNVKIFQTNSTLVIMNPDKDAVGKYTCQTQPGVSGDDIISKVIHVIYLDLRKVEKSRNVVEKESITLDCPADGIPPPGIIWLKDQKPISEIMINDTRISFGENSNGMINGTLTINNAQWGDRGNYTCVVTSLLQSYEKWTFVRVKDMYAALWPFIGIVIEVVVLGIIIIIFEKRRAKAEFDESDTDQGNDQKNTADHFKDARRRK